MYTNLNTGAIGIKTTLAGSLDLASRFGFKGVDFSIVDAAQASADVGPERLRAELEAAGVLPGAWNPPVAWSGDEAQYQEQLDQLTAYAELAQKLGATRAATWVPPASNDRSFDENFAFHVARFRPIAQVLSDHGCRLGLEFIGPATLRAARRYPFIYDAKGMQRLGAAIGTGNVGLLLDCWHWYTSGDTLQTLDSLNNADVVVVHVNDAPAGVPIHEQLDNVRCLPAETGVIDIAAFLNALANMGYDGPVTVEPFSAAVRALAPDDAVRATAASLDRAWTIAGMQPWR